MSQKRRHRTKSTSQTTSQYDNENDDDNIYDLPKMPPVPVALPPPQRYANEDKPSQVEQLYNKVTKSKPSTKSLQTSQHPEMIDEDDGIANDDLYAQDSLIQADNRDRDDRGVHEEAGFYENVGYEASEASKREAETTSGGQERFKPASTIFGVSEDSFITVGEALERDEPDWKSPKDQTVENSAEALYDVPRSNRRVSSKQLEKQQLHKDEGKQLQKQQQQLGQLPSEAIYVNDGFVAGVVDVDATYDVPTTTTTTRNDDFVLLGEVLPENYDVARTRDSLSTIEEEHQEYDIPRAAVAAAAELAAARLTASKIGQTTATTAPPPPPPLPPPITTELEENYYENTLPHSVKHRGLREADIFITEEAPKSSSDYGSHAGDDRSSGYRSSSSPSIQSTEELYVNESAIGSLDSRDSASPELVNHRAKNLKNISETSGFNSVKKSKEKESKLSEKEKPFGEAEKSIVKKKEFGKKSSAASVQPPRSFFTDFVSNKIVEPKPEIEIGTKERRKKFEAPQPPKQPTPAVQQPPKPVPASKTESEDKKVSQRDRSVDVYNETVRQRVARNVVKGGVEITKDVFNRVDAKAVTNVSVKRSGDVKLNVDDLREELKANRQFKKIEESDVDVDNETTQKATPTFVKKRRAPQPTHKCNDINDEDLPSVRQLRDKFENDQGPIIMPQ